MFENISQIVKSNFLMISNGEKRKAKSEGRWNYLVVKNYQSY